MAQFSPRDTHGNPALTAHSGRDRALAGYRLAQAGLERLRGWSLMRNSVFIMGTTIVTSGLGYLYWLIAAHAYTAYEVGLASTLIAAMALVASFSNLGLGATLIHILPKRESGAAWSAALTTALATVSALGGIAGLLVLAIAPLIVPGAGRLFAGLSLPLALAFGLGVIFSSLGVVLDQAFVAERASVNMLYRNIAFSTLKLALIAAPLLLIFTRNALFILLSWVIALALSDAIAVVALIPRLRRQYRPTLADAPAQLRSMRRWVVGNHFINVGSMAPMYLLPVFVSLRLSVTQSAYFYTTWMVAGVVFMITPSIANSLFAEGSHHPDEVIKHAKTSLKVGAALLAPAVVLFALFGRHILALFGRAYAAQGAALLVVLVIAGIPDGATNIYISVLRVRGRMTTASALNLGMAACTLVGAWLLLPTMGVVGAGVAWLLAQCLGSAFCGLDLARLRAREASAGDTTPQQEPGTSWRGWRPPTRPTWTPSRRSVVVAAHTIIVGALLGLLFFGPHLSLIRLTLPAAQPPVITEPAPESAMIQLALLAPTKTNVSVPTRSQATRIVQSVVQTQRAQPPAPQATPTASPQPTATSAVTRSPTVSPSPAPSPTPTTTPAPAPTATPAPNGHPGKPMK